MLCICARVVSTICSGQPSARAAAASFSMTCSLFFSLLLAVSMRQVDIASKAAFTALRASSESAGAHVGLKLRGVTSAYLFCMAASPLTDCKDPLGGPRGQRPSSVLLKVSQWPVTAPGASLHFCVSAVLTFCWEARPAQGRSKNSFHWITHRRAGRKARDPGSRGLLKASRDLPTSLEPS